MQGSRAGGVKGSHTDMWGFAACVLHLATGQQPYLGLTFVQTVTAMLKKTPPEVPNSLPSWLQQALQQCLSFDPAARPSASQLQQVGAAAMQQMAWAFLLLMLLWPCEIMQT